jgi:hypothetical protein
MVLDPQIVLDSLQAADTLHHSGLLSEACGNLGACLADAAQSSPAKAAQTGVDLTSLANKDQIIQSVSQQLKPLTTAADSALSPAMKALAPVTDAASKLSASFPQTQDLVKMLPPEVIAAEKSLEVAMKPAIAFVTPLLLAVAQVIHIISNDSDNDLFNGCEYPTHVMAKKQMTSTLSLHNRPCTRCACIPGTNQVRKTDRWLLARMAKSHLEVCPRSELYSAWPCRSACMLETCCNAQL